MHALHEAIGEIEDDLEPSGIPSMQVTAAVSLQNCFKSGMPCRILVEEFVKLNLCKYSLE